MRGPGEAPREEQHLRWGKRGHSGWRMEGGEEQPELCLSAEDLEHAVPVGSNGATLGPVLEGHVKLVLCASARRSHRCSAEEPPGDSRALRQFLWQLWRWRAHTGGIKGTGARVRVMVLPVGVGSWWCHEKSISGDSQRRMRSSDKSYLWCQKQN